MRETLKWIKSNILPLAAVVVAVLNVWFMYKLAPILENIHSLTYRVQALESVATNNLPYVNQFIVLQEQVKQIAPQIEKLDAKADRIESKVDKILQK